MTNSRRKGHDYYNENDAFAADWLEALIEAGHLPRGDVDRRSIAEVRAEDLAGYGQCHFFAGIGGWPYALSLAGWEGPAWTGSCPCQPFSLAGKGRGKADERHLWPVWRELIRECQPPVVFGEQVASPAGRDWLSGVRLQMEEMGYEVGAADLCAAGIGAPHIRQRLWFVADTIKQRSIQDKYEPPEKGSADPRPSPSGQLQDGITRCSEAGGNRYGRLGNSLGQRLEVRPKSKDRARALWQEGQTAGSSSSWGVTGWVSCRDGKQRPVEPGTFPLAHGVPARVGRLRGYGNAIVPQLAAEFIGAYIDLRQ